MPPFKPLPPTFFRMSSPANCSPPYILCVCPSANYSPATLKHGATREMVGAVPVCPPERPRSDVSIRKRHIPIHKGSVSMRRNVCALRMMYTCYRWMRPYRATRAGTQAPPLPISIKPLFRQSFLMFVCWRAPRRQSFRAFARRQTLRRQPWNTEPHEKW